MISFVYERFFYVISSHSSLFYPFLFAIILSSRSSLLLSFPLALCYCFSFLPLVLLSFFYHHVFFLSFHFLPASFPFYLIYFFHLFRNKSIFPLTCCGLGYALLRVKGLRGNERTDEGRSESGLQSGGMEKRQIDAGKRRGERKLDGKRE